MGNGRNPMDRLIDAVGELSLTFRSEMGSMQNTFRDEIGTLRTELTGRLDRMDERLESMDERLGSVDERLGRIDLRLGTVETRLNQVVINTGAHWLDLDRRVTDLEKKNKNGA